MQSTGIKVLPEQWDKQAGKVIRHPQRQMLNTVLVSRMNDWQRALLHLSEEGKISRRDTAARVKDKITAYLNPPEETDKEGSFLRHFYLFAEGRRTPGTRDTYHQTIRRMQAFDAELGRRTFEEIDRRWLEDFDRFLSQTAPSVNARAFHYRNIRAVFNDAIDEELTAAYPFRKFKIRRERTASRALTVEELRTLATYPCQEYQRMYRDLFMLMFYLIGINAVDLLNAPADAIRGGRLEYVRSKTGKRYSVKVEPEAMQLLQQYRGTRHLLSVMDERTDYKAWLHRMNDALKCIGPVQVVSPHGKKACYPLFPRLSQYWCRHTWATLAAELDIPKETIAAALGHGGDTVTDIYIRFDRRKVDEANRRVINYVFGR